MIGETALVGAINAWLTQRKIDKWARLLIGCALSGACTMASVWGSGGIAHIMAGTPWPVSLALGFCEGLISASAIVFFKFRHDPVTKDMSISVPAALEAAEREILEKEGITTFEHK